MGPKKTKPKKEKKGIPTEQDVALRESELERIELVKQAKSLLEMTKKEEQAFNEFQQQREKLNYFWIIEKKNLEDRKSELSML